MTADLWTGWAELMLHATTKVSLLVVLALLVITAVRSLSAGVRHTILAGALAAGLATPLLWALAPGWGPQLRLGPSSGDGGPPLVGAAGPGGAPTPAAAVEEPGSGPGEPLRRPDPPALPGSAFVVWSLGVLALAWRAWRARRARGRLEAAAHPVVDAFLRDTLRSCAARLDVRRPVRLLESGRAPGPMTWGVRHPRILLPAGASHWPRARQRVVLLHELAHVRRRDAWTRLLADLAVAVLWFDPVVWLAARRLSAEAETACDDLVLAQGVRPSRYLHELVALAREMRPGRGPQAVLGMTGGRGFGRRAAAIADAGRPMRPPTAACTGTAWALAAVLALLVAGVGKSAPLPPPAVDDDASGELRALWRSEERGAYLQGLLDEGSHAVPMVLALAPEIGNDAVLESLLLRVLGDGLEPARLGPFVAASRLLEADAARQQVLLRLVARTRLPEGALLEVIRTTDEMRSEAARTDVLRAVARSQALSEAAAAELRRATDRLERPSSRRAVLGDLSHG